MSFSLYSNGICLQRILEFVAVWFYSLAPRCLISLLRMFSRLLWHTWFFVRLLHGI